jgi:hypothetical protein
MSAGRRRYFNCNGGVWGWHRGTPMKAGGARTRRTTLQRFWILISNRIASTASFAAIEALYDEQPAAEFLLT